MKWLNRLSTAAAAAIVLGVLGSDSAFASELAGWAQARLRAGIRGMTARFAAVAMLIAH